MVSLLFTSNFYSILRSNSILITLNYIARNRNQRLWLVGGTIRDLLLGQIPLDLDLTVTGNTLALGQALAKKIGARFVLLKEDLPTCRIILSSNIIKYLDLTSLRAINIEADLIERDYTVNALALELGDFLTGRYLLIDPSGGQNDLRYKILRPLSSKVLVDDPLRVLRGFRFIATHALYPTSSTLKKLSAAAPGLFRVARERLAQEWRKLMTGVDVSLALEAMEETQTLTRLLPELAQGRGIEQNPFHHLTVFKHNLACVEALEKIFGELLNFLPPGPISYLAEDNQRMILKTAALLHDLGKPITRQYKKPGWFSFYQHDIIGANLALKATRRIGLSKAESEQIARLVREHMRPFQLLELFNQGILTSRAVQRMLLAIGSDLTGLFLLSLADTIAGRGPQRPAETEKIIIQLWKIIIKFRDEKLAKSLQAPPLINGHILMRELGLSPGVKIGQLLNLLRQAQLDGNINNETEALLLARRLLKSKIKEN